MQFLALVLLILSACAVVAISADGPRLLLPSADLTGPWVWGVRMAGASTALAGLGVLISQRRRRREASGRNPEAIVGSLRRAATIMGLLTLVALIVHPLPAPGDALRRGTRSPSEETSPQGGGGADASPPSGWAGGGSRGSGGGGGARGSGGATSAGGGAQQNRSLLQQLTGTLPLALLLVVAVVCAFLLMRRQRRPPEAFLPYLPLAPEDAEGGLEASLAEVAGDGGDPRDQITAAYFTLLAALAAAGAPRQVQEAPHEHLYRVLGPLGVRPEPLHHLIGLYVMAQFSLRPITDRHRAAAVHSLEVSLASLRQPTGSHEDDGFQGVPVEATA